MSSGVARQHYNVTFTLLAVAAVAYALLQSLVAFAAVAVALAMGFVVALLVPRPERGPSSEALAEAA